MARVTSWKRLALMLSGFVLLVACSSHPPPSSDDFHPGEHLYQASCASCHGRDGGGKILIGFPLRGSKSLAGEKDAMINTLLNGRPKTTMLGFKDLMTEDDLVEVFLFIRRQFASIDDAPDEVRARIRKLGQSPTRGR